MYIFGFAIFFMPVGCHRKTLGSFDLSPLSSQRSFSPIRANRFHIEALDSRRPAGYTSKVRVRDRYHIVGFISSGTYGRVYKAVRKNGEKGEFAIKKLVSIFLLAILSVLTFGQVQAR